MPHFGTHSNRLEDSFSTAGLCPGRGTEAIEAEITLFAQNGCELGRLARPLSDVELQRDRAGVARRGDPLEQGSDRKHALGQRGVRIAAGSEVVGQMDVNDPILQFVEGADDVDAAYRKMAGVKCYRRELL